MSLMIPPGENLVTYYVLPMLTLNKNSFGSSFKNSYIDRAGTRVYVELGTNMKVPSYKNHPNYITEIVHQGHIIVMFTVYSHKLKDVGLFLEGKYSQMSKETKQMIYNTSTLPYNKTMGSFKNTDPILQALDKTKTLRAWLEKRLNLKPLPESAELITKPLDDWFIEFKLCTE